jgi:hypothetical protein
MERSAIRVPLPDFAIARLRRAYGFIRATRSDEIQSGSKFIATPLMQ